MGGKSGGGNSTVTQNADPWSGVVPYLKQILGDSQGLYQNKTPQYDQSAYDAALKDWEGKGGATNATPDTAGYQSALDKWKASAGGSQSPLDRNAWLVQESAAGKSYQNRSSDPMQTVSGAYDAYTKGFKPTAPQGAAPTQDQFMSYGAAGAKPTLEQFTVPGTQGASALAPAYYQGQTIADQSPETLAANALTTSRALNGSSVMNNAKDYTTGLLGGSFLSPESNPYLKDTFNRGADQVQQRVNSAFGNGGRFGSGVNQEVLGKGMNDLASQVYGGAYDSERNRMQQGLLFAPQLAANDYQDLSALSSVGANKDSRSQDVINQNIQKYNYNSNLPFNAITNYKNLVNGNYGGGSSTQTTPYSSNGAATGLGLLGAMGGVGGLGSLLGGGTAAATGLPWLASAGTGSQLGALGKAAMSAFSDVRLKENIKHIGHENGFPVYAFSYKSDPDKIKYRGVMAQDLLEMGRGDAVSWHGEYMAVDYSKIGVEFGRIH
jgi:hypothetical protein